MMGYAFIPRIPLSDWIEWLKDWVGVNFAPFFSAVRTIIVGIVESFEFVFDFIPPLILILLIAALMWWIGSWRLGLFALAGMYLIYNLGYWYETMDTLALVLTAALISVVAGIPLGIWCAKSNTVQSIVTPILDFMQTMPAFVYLLPAVSFFRLGVVPGVIASVIFAIPPTIRLTNLGIRQVPEDLVEAADAYGSTSLQKLFKLQVPLAVPTIMAGINQTIMLALSMVVIAAMIGAQGIGVKVYTAITQAKVGLGFEAGLAVVVLAIILDRLTQNIVKNKRRG